MLVEHNEIKNEDGSIGYIESIFTSDNILKTTYFPKDKRLYIAFKRGHTYSYFEITEEMYYEFEESESQGKYFLKHINKNPNITYRKEFSLYPNEIQEINETIKNKGEFENE